MILFKQVCLLGRLLTFDNILDKIPDKYQIIDIFLNNFKDTSSTLGKSQLEIIVNTLINYIYTMLTIHNKSLFEEPYDGIYCRFDSDYGSDYENTYFS